MYYFYTNSFKSNKSFVLDQIQNASATLAYSLRKLTKTATRAIRVRRSSDNTEQDISFDSKGDLDTSALTQFVGVGNGFVTTWYDQSGNGNNATQTTVASQPLLLSGGSLVVTGNKPAIYTNGSSTYLRRSDFSASQPFTYCAVERLKSSSSPNYRWIFDAATGSVLAGFHGNPLLSTIYAGSHIYGTDTFVNDVLLSYSGIVNGSSSKYYNNGNLMFTGNPGSNALSGLVLGANGSSNSFQEGYYCEFIIFPSSLSDGNLSIIERNQIQYFGI